MAENQIGFFQDKDLFGGPFILQMLNIMSGSLDAQDVVVSFVRFIGLEKWDNPDMQRGRNRMKRLKGGTER